MSLPGTDPWRREPVFQDWKKRLASLPDSRVEVRAALPNVEDGKRMCWIQATCESLFIHNVGFNVSKVEKQIVLMADISGDPIGFCVALAGRTEIAPVFVQLVAVVPQARQRGAGLALVRAVARAEPHRDIVLAIQDENTASRALSQRVAVSLNSKIRRVPIRSYRRSELGIAEGEVHRAWLITRSESAPPLDADGG